ncbi:hypothetical protein AXG93_4905s1250 [Marchantia polymorpha subsp. ruderalis]|uniref:Gamma-glutamylcyclotransferase family protein n=1 Tax=Marchantia polymorpha subsp. ruderalis TaxID=1480154 RepID=A0A176VKF1_MARPO|nr:hypothetical protein AXG93_4905s1250 [Marchantia polymorpha subsp. ruderalis]
MSIMVAPNSWTLNNSVRCSAQSVVSTRKKETSMPASKVAHVDSSTKESSVVDSPQKALEASPTSLAFVYGTLKRGFGNHWLMEEQMSKKHARLVGTAQTKMRYPLVCGPFQVPFLLMYPGEGEHVRGELYQVDSHCMELLDELEGVSKDHYERRQIVLTGIELDPSFKFSLQNGLNGFSANQGYALMDAVVQPGEVKAEAYFAHPHYTPGMYRAPHLEAYTEKEAATYTRGIHQPQNRTFLKHVYHWIEEHKQELYILDDLKGRGEEEPIRPQTCASIG